ncbi:MAG: hypothetical protein ACRD8Z_05535 [Nitrososphaeraceae archaeon]
MRVLSPPFNVPSLLFFSCVLIGGFIFFNSAFSQNYTADVKAQRLDDNTLSDNTTASKQFNVTFNGIAVNTDHDPLYTGEWVMDAYVNDIRVPLWAGALEAGSGETIFFDTLGYGVDEYYSPIGGAPLEGQSQGYSAAVTVPQNGELRIVLVGYEHDWFGSSAIPDISDRLNMNITFPSYVLRAQNTIADLLQSNLNDPNGFVAASFTAEDNYGVGRHIQCSLPNKQAIDVQVHNLDDINTCDFEIIYTIEELA